MTEKCVLCHSIGDRIKRENNNPNTIWTMKICPKCGMEVWIYSGQTCEDPTDTELELARAVIELSNHLPDSVYKSNPASVDLWVRMANEILVKSWKQRERDGSE